MANSPLVSVRIPPETLKRIDKLAEQLYPARRVGRNPNRSQLILQAIEQFLQENEFDDNHNLQVEEQINKALQEYQAHLEQQIKKYIDDKFVAYAYNMEQRLSSRGKLLAR